MAPSTSCLKLGDDGLYYSDCLQCLLPRPLSIDQKQSIKSIQLMLGQKYFIVHVSNICLQEIGHFARPTRGIVMHVQINNMFDNNTHQSEESVQLSSQASSNMLDAIELMQGTQWNLPLPMKQQVEKISQTKNLSLFSNLYNITYKTTIKDKANHLSQFSNKRQPQFSLFTNGLGKSVKCSGDAMKMAMTLMEDKQPQVQTSFGFQTGNNKKIEVNNDVLKKAKQLLSSQSQLRKTKTKMVKTKEALSNSKTEANKIKTKQVEELQTINYPQHIFRLKLSDLDNISTFMNDYVQPTQFLHRQCRQLFCHFCKLNISCAVITKEMIYDSFKAKYDLQQHLFQPLYDLASFKLKRFNTYYPELINKRLTASNVYYQIQKIYRRKNTTLKLINQGRIQQGVGLVLLVKDILQNQLKNLYFLQLTDGWSTIYAVLNHGNTLSRPLIEQVNNNKLYIGCKLKVAGWHFYPISNIIKNSTGRSIQILYNGTNKASIKQKLGLLRTPFYRPIRKCLLNSLIINIQLMVLKKFYHPDGLFFYLLMSDPFQDVYMLKVHGSEQVSCLYKNRQVYMLSNIRLLSWQQLQTLKKTTVKQIKKSLLLQSFDRVIKKRIHSCHSVVGSNYDVIIKQVVQESRTDDSIIVRDKFGKSLLIVGTKIAKSVCKSKLNGHAVIEELMLTQTNTFRETQWSRLRICPPQTYYQL